MGTDSFNYTVYDSSGNMSTATVTVTVIPATFEPGEAVQVSSTAIPHLNVRSSPNGQIVGSQQPEAKGVININSFPEFVGGYWWWQVDFSTSPSGWVAEPFLTTLVSENEPVEPSEPTEPVEPSEPVEPTEPVEIDDFGGWSIDRTFDFSSTSTTQFGTDGSQCRTMTGTFTTSPQPPAFAELFLSNDGSAVDSFGNTYRMYSLIDLRGSNSKSYVYAIYDGDGDEDGLYVQYGGLITVAGGTGEWLDGFGCRGTWTVTLRDIEPSEPPEPVEPTEPVIDNPNTITRFDGTYDTTSVNTITFSSLGAICGTSSGSFTVIN